MNIQQGNNTPKEGSEAVFEKQLITHLQNIGGTKQWQYRPDIKTTKDLWNNFRTILERNNSGKLEGKPLTDNEFRQVQHEILRRCSSPFRAGQWIYGFNGVTQVTIQRDEKQDKQAIMHTHPAMDLQNTDSDSNRSRTIFLTVFDQDQVGAGNTTYQIVNQIKRPHVHVGRPDRRFDTTLLINGLPMIQIEEKSAAHNVDEALRQEQRYIEEGQYGGIFSTLQILVGMTPYDCKYMANTDLDHFSLDFAFRWQKANGDPVYDWRTFTDLMLSIPMAHQMATSYMILDGETSNEQLMIMRPYQVYATRRVIRAIKDHDFSTGKAKGIGYVWHTTGSGKTITSFKTAWLASRLPSVDKVIFLVDRIALTRQTYDKYRAYDPDATADSSGVVSDTRNVFDLARKIRSKQSKNSIIVTSIQKMGDLCSRPSFQQVAKRCVFICDEAHRSTNGTMLQNIQSKFPFSAWVGYTGTPIFDDNTTKKIFGPCLHAYTIKQGIADKNVLGFKVDFEHTLDSDEIKEKLLPKILAGKHPTWDDERIHFAIARIEPQKVDDLIDSGVYDMNVKHVRAVVTNIFKHWINRSVYGRYSAILTTHVRQGASTPMAMMYFKEFFRQNQIREQHGESTLTVAVTFSMLNNHDNEENQNNHGLEYAIKIYNKEFGTNFGLDSIDEYFTDVSSRLRGDASSGNGKKLNLAIVVDQLLTGFDAPKLNTLYVDRTLSGASLIQAYSRTNRIDDNQYKPFGRIINFRWPQTSKQLMDDALRVYANRESAFSSKEVKLPKVNPVVFNLDKTEVDVKRAVNAMRNLTHNFIDLRPGDPDDQKECLRQLGIFNCGVTALKQDENRFNPQDPEKFWRRLGISKTEEKKINALSHILTDKKSNPVDPSNPLDLDFHVEHVGEERVNYSYLEKLLAEYMNARYEGSDEAEAKLANYRDASAQFEDRQKAHRLDDLAKAAQSSPNGRLTGVNYPVKPNDVSQIAVENERSMARSQILSFRTQWGLLDVDGAKDIIDRLISRHTPGSDDLNGEDMNLLKLKVTKTRFYKKDATDKKIREMGILEYRNALQQALGDLADKVLEEAPDLQ